MADVPRHRLAVTVVFALNGLLFASLFARMPAIKDDAGMTNGQLGAALLAAGLALIVSQLAGGAIAARVGSRPGVIAGAALYGLLLPLPTLAPSPLGFAAGMVVLALGAGVLDVAMNAQAVELEHRVGRSIMSGFHALFSAGGMAGAVLGGLIASWHVPVAMHFTVAALVLVATAAALRSSLIEAPRPEPGHAGPRLRLSRALAGLSVLAACVMIGEGAMADWTPVYLATVIGTGPGLAASGYAVFSATMMVGRLVGDRLTERVGRVPLVRFGTLLAAAGMSVALLLGTLPAALAGFAFVGAGFSVAVPLVFSAAGRLDSRSAGPGLAAVTTAGYLGFLAGPPIIGVVAQAFTLPLAMFLIVVLALAGTALAGVVAIDAPVAD